MAKAVPKPIPFLITSPFKELSEAKIGDEKSKIKSKMERFLFMFFFSFIFKYTINFKIINRKFGIQKAKTTFAK